MIVGITGYGATGASAYIDLLKEFEGIQSLPSSIEFQLLQQQDGICDLKYYLVKAGRRLSTNCILKRFQKNILNPRIYNVNKITGGKYKSLTEEYFKKLVQIQWQGKSGFDPVDIKSFYDVLSMRMVNRAINKILRNINGKYGWPLPQKRYFSYFNEEEFDRITSEYLHGILESLGFFNDSPIMLEQIFNTTHPTEGMEYFDDARSLVIDRDPRDVYVISNMTMRSGASFMPNTGDVKDFVSYYRALHTPKSNDPRVIYLQYEDLIYDYEQTILKISELLGLKHVNKGAFFKPEYSINNTQQYLKHPELEKEIQYIEEHLIDLLYPFDEKKSNITYTPKNVKAFDRQSDADKKIQ